MSKEELHQRGLTLVYTGDGKGKTTAALGIALRSVGRGLKVKIFQFIKSPKRTYGEQIALQQLGVEMEQLGVGFTWTKTAEEHREALKKGWFKAKTTMMEGAYDVVILDELNNALAIEDFPIEDVLPLDEVIEVIQKRPKHVHLVITGRNAKQEVKELANLVSVIEPEKHYYDKGISSVKGLEF